MSQRGGRKATLYAGLGGRFVEGAPPLRDGKVAFFVRNEMTKQRPTRSLPFFYVKTLNEIEGLGFFIVFFTFSFQYIIIRGVRISSSSSDCTFYF